jgi:hypothetical protein
MGVAARLVASEQALVIGIGRILAHRRQNRATS